MELSQPVPADIHRGVAMRSSIANDPVNHFAPEGNL
jgi:hypothetical protein